MVLFMLLVPPCNSHFNHQQSSNSSSPSCSVTLQGCSVWTEACIPPLAVCLWLCDTPGLCAITWRHSSALWSRGTLCFVCQDEILGLQVKHRLLWDTHRIMYTSMSNPNIYCKYLHSLSVKIRLLSCDALDQFQSLRQRQAQVGYLTPGTPKQRRPHTLILTGVTELLTAVSCFCILKQWICSCLAFRGVCVWCLHLRALGLLSPVYY